jgi:hypothetical protein
LVELVRKLNVDELILVVNDVPPAHNPQAVKAQTERTYGAEVGVLIPHSETLMTLGSSGIFALLHPTHQLTVLLKELASRLLR